jgi:hypothetical protein
MEASIVCLKCVCSTLVAELIWGWEISEFIATLSCDATESSYEERLLLRERRVCLCSDAD